MGVTRFPGASGPVSDHGSLTGLADVADHAYALLIDGTRALTADWDAGSFEVRAATFESDIATGTAPLVIASTTKVTNLNADLLDDQTGSYYLDSANFAGTNWTDLTDASATTLHKHDHGGMDGLADDDHTQYLLADGSRALSADWDAGSFEIRAQTFESDVTTGTAPLTIASTTKVANLNADLLDDQTGSYYLDSDNFAGTEWTDLTDAGATTLHKHDHGGEDGLGDDDHTQYALLAGRSGGQTLTGGTGSGDDLTLLSTSDGTKGTIFLGTASAYDQVNDRLGLGDTTPSFKLDIVDSSTATSGTVNTQSNVLTINPASNSSGTFRSGLFSATISDGNTVAFTGAAAAMGASVTHRGDGNVTGLYGILLQGFIGPSIGAAADTASVTSAYGSVFSLYHNSLGVSSTRVLGAEFDVRNRGTTTIGTMTACHIGIGSQDSGSGAGTITAAFGLRVSGLSSIATDILSAGTITNGTMVEIGDWTSGPTYSNPPVQLKLIAATPSNAIAIYQDGTGGYNKYEGFSMLGADAAPESPLEVNSSSSLGQQLVTLDQDDTDQSFIDFQGNTGANATASLSTFTVAVLNGYIQVEINGTKKWIAYYNDPTV